MTLKFPRYNFVQGLRRKKHNLILIGILKNCDAQFLTSGSRDWTTKFIHNNMILLYYSYCDILMSKCLNADFSECF